MGWSTGRRRRSFTSMWSESERNVTGESASSMTAGSGTLREREEAVRVRKECEE